MRRTIGAWVFLHRGRMEKSGQCKHLPSSMVFELILFLNLINITWIGRFFERNLDFREATVVPNLYVSTIYLAACALCWVTHQWSRVRSIYLQSSPAPKSFYAYDSRLHYFGWKVQTPFRYWERCQILSSQHLRWCSSFSSIDESRAGSDLG